MNRVEITHLKNLLSLMNDINKYSVYLEDIINKESIKREKNIENATKYAKERNQVDSDIISNKESILNSNEFKDFLTRFKEKQEIEEDDVVTNNHNDLD